MQLIRFFPVDFVSRESVTATGYNTTATLWGCASSQTLMWAFLQANVLILAPNTAATAGVLLQIKS